MVHVITFDTLAYANKLKNAGMEHKLAETQAEVQAELLASLMDDQLATKQDIKDLRKEVHSEIKGIRHEMIAELLAMESRLLVKLGGITVTGIGLLATLFTILHTH